MLERQATVAELRSAFEDHMRANFLERDLAQVLATLDDEITGFGTGADEIALENGRMKALFERDIHDAPNPIHLDFHAQEIAPLGPDLGLVTAVFDLNTEIGDQPLMMDDLRLSLVLRRRGDVWHVLHMHLSMPAKEHEEGESYPLKELQRRNQWLEESVAAKTSELRERNRALEEALAHVKQLSGLLPICSSCKRIRDDDGYWQELADYLGVHTDAELTHGICPACMRKLYPEFADELDERPSHE